MNANTYSIIEIDANDKTLVLASGVSRSAAIARLTRLRETYGKDGLRFVMYHDERIGGNKFSGRDIWR